MQGELLIPSIFLILYQALKRFDKKWVEVISGPLLSAPILFSIIMGFDMKYIFAYGFFSMLSGFDTKGIYSVIFGIFFAYISRIMGSQLIVLLPLSIVVFALPLANLLNLIMWRSEKRKLWYLLMFSFSTGISAYILTASENINPLWALLIGAIATWSAKLDENFTLPLFTFISLGFLDIAPKDAIAGFGFSLIASSLAYYLNALDIKGLIGAIIIGTFIYASSPVLFVTLLGFLVSSSIIGKFTYQDERFQEKGHRTAIQVLSNAFGAVLAGMFILKGFNFVGGGIAAVAAATADTWATEIGSFSKRKPRLITTMRIVEPGVSGGVTVMGLLGSLLAGIFIAMLTFPFFGISYAMDAVLGAIVGSLSDSFLGATSQGIYKCRVCKKLTEKQHHCGTKTTLVKGIWWVNNDLVNMLATLIALVVAV